VEERSDIDHTVGKNDNCRLGHFMLMQRIHNIHYTAPEDTHMKPQISISDSINNKYGYLVEL
jgi:hypothetical protein